APLAPADPSREAPRASGVTRISMRWGWRGAGARKRRRLGMGAGLRRRATAGQLAAPAWAAREALTTAGAGGRRAPVRRGSPSARNENREPLPVGFVTARRTDSRVRRRKGSGLSKSPNSALS